MSRPTLSLVLPVYNEEEVIPELYTRLQAFLEQLGTDAEIIFVNDGSKDRSLELLRAMTERDERCRVLSFSRNFGHQTAISAGIDYARGRAVVVMDADLQDPPDVVRQMMDKWREGYDVVYGKRATRAGETAFKLFTAKAFYRIFAAMIPIEVPLDTGDFRLMSRRVVIALRSLRESHRFVRGLVSWVGFKQTAVLYDRPGRFAGETKYPLRKMIRFAIDGITSFSILPLRFSTYLGVVTSIGSVVLALWALVAHLFFNATVPGWTATVVIITLLASVQLLMIGILGEYVGRIYEEIKRRPLYVVGDRINLGERDDDVLDETDMAPRVPSTVPTTMGVPAQPIIPVAPAPEFPPPAAPPPPAAAPPAAAPEAQPAETPALAAVVASPPPSDRQPVSQPIPSSRPPKGPPPLPAGASKPPPPLPRGPVSKPPSAPTSKPPPAPAGSLSKKTLMGMPAQQLPDKPKEKAEAGEKK
jgi:dolichol-phosphate mannosyltransferase